MIGSWVRSTAFWMLDAVKGGEIKKNYLDVKRRMTSGEINSAQLNKLLNHAVETVPYYNDYSAEAFQKFPIITKNDLKENWEKMHSEAYLGKPMHHMSTSGSTGTPFTMDWDMGKRKHQLAELIYFNEIIGQKLGDRYIFFRVWTEKNRKSKLEAWMQNLLPVDTTRLDDDNLCKMYEALKSKPKVNMCMGYGSTYGRLIRYLSERNVSPKEFDLSVCISGSEVLELGAKQKLKELLGCTVVDRYANEENGFLAQSEDCSDIFKVNTASFLIEILKMNSDEPADIGELGRIVVTDLYNFAVPLIRYDNGDLAIKHEERDGWVTKLKTIQGRKADIIYDTADREISCLSVTNHMWGYDKLKQFQLIQEDQGKYVMKLNGAKGYYTDEEIIDNLKGFLGADACIAIEHVDGIPTLASGKFKKTICKYQPKCVGDTIMKKL